MNIATDNPSCINLFNQPPMQVLRAALGHPRTVEALLEKIVVSNNRLRRRGDGPDLEVSHTECIAILDQVLEHTGLCLDRVN